MLPLPQTELVRARSVTEAVAALAGAPGETQVIAGGTDLLPNLKHGLHGPRRLVSLRRIAELNTIATRDDGGLSIGTGVTLARVAGDETISQLYPALARAASFVASPQIRGMATLGGNLCLDTRCVYYNQTHFWRDALGYCLKKEGTVCHVVPKGRRCVAAFSADTPGPLIAYGASVRLVSSRGERSVPVAAFFRADGIANTVRAHDELLVAVDLPAPPAGLRCGYEKLRMRGAIDFPALAVTAAAQFDEHDNLRTLSLVIGALGAKPNIVARLDDKCAGRRLDDAAKTAVGEIARAQCVPLSNINIDPEWRREVVPVYVRRALEGMLPSARPDALPPRR